MANANLNITLRVHDQATAKIKRAVDTAEREQRRQRRNKGPRDAAGYASALAGAAHGLQDFGYAARQAVGVPLMLAADFEKGLKAVNAFSGGTFSATGQLAKIETEARRLGSTTEFTARQVLDGSIVMTQAGMDFEKQMASLPTIVDVATIAQTDLAEATDILTGALFGFNKPAKDAAYLADVMAQAAVSSKTSVQELGRAFKVVAPISTTLGVGVEDTATAVAVLAQNMFRGAEAGQALKAVYGNLAAPTKMPQQEVLKVLGISRKELRNAFEAKDAQGNQDLSAPLRLMQEAMEKKGIEKTQRAALLKTFFGMYRYAVADALLMSTSKQMDGSSRSWDTVKGSISQHKGASGRMAEEMRQGLTAELTKLRSALEETAITAGSILIPQVKDLAVQGQDAALVLAKFAKENPKLVESLGKMLLVSAGLASVLTPMLLTFSALNAVITSGRLIMIGYAASTKLAHAALGKTRVGRALGTAYGRSTAGINAGLGHVVPQRLQGVASKMSLLGGAAGALTTSLAMAGVVVGVFQQKIDDLLAWGREQAAQAGAYAGQVAPGLSDREIDDRIALLDKQSKEQEAYIQKLREDRGAVAEGLAFVGMTSLSKNEAEIQGRKDVVAGYENELTELYKERALRQEKRDEETNVRRVLDDIGSTHALGEQLQTRKGVKRYKKGIFDAQQEASQASDQLDAIRTDVAGKIEVTVKQDGTGRVTKADFGKKIAVSVNNGVHSG